MYLILSNGSALIVIKIFFLLLPPFLLHKILPKILFKDRAKLFNIIMEFFLQTISYTILPLVLIGFKDLQSIFSIEQIFEFNTAKVMIILYLITLPFLCIGVRIRKLQEEYPLWKGFKTSKLQMKISYIFLYLLYYINWEFYFRGILILYMLNNYPGEFSGNKDYNFTILNFVQSILAGLFHYDKPLPEFIVSFPANFIFGYIAYQYRSIIPCIIIHYLIGVTFDLLATYARGKN
ncbi:MAG: CPBP family intramembrane glutamic endopeptidase [Planctomycetota bacterium]